MVVSVVPRRDVIARAGKLLLIAALIVGAIIVTRVILVQNEWGDTGALHTIRHIGYVLTTPFHNLVSGIDSAKGRELVNDMIAVAVYVGAGLIIWRLLK